MDYDEIRLSVILDIHKILEVAKEDIMIDVLLEFATLLDDPSVDPQVRTKIEERLRELENKKGERLRREGKLPGA